MMITIITVTVILVAIKITSLSRESCSFIGEWRQTWETKIDS